MTATYFDRFVLAGGFMMIILIPASLLALMWGFQSLIRLRMSRIAPQALLIAARQVPDAKGAEDFIAMLAAHSSPLAKLTLRLLRGQRISDVISHHRDAEFEAALKSEMEFLHHEITGLSAIYKVVPAIGLLGTLIALMRTFGNFAADQSRTFESLIAGGRQRSRPSALGPCHSDLIIFVRATCLRAPVCLREEDPPRSRARTGPAVVEEKSKTGSRGILGSLKFKVQGSKFKVQSLRFKVQSLRFKVNKQILQGKVSALVGAAKIIPEP